MLVGTRRLDWGFFMMPSFSQFSVILAHAGIHPFGAQRAELVDSRVRPLCISQVGRVPPSWRSHESLRTLRGCAATAGPARLKRLIGNGQTYCKSSRGAKCVSRMRLYRERIKAVRGNDALGMIDFNTQEKTSTARSNRCFPNRCKRRACPTPSTDRSAEWRRSQRRSTEWRRGVWRHVR